MIDMGKYDNWLLENKLSWRNHIWQSYARKSLVCITYGDGFAEFSTKGNSQKLYHLALCLL